MKRLIYVSAILLVILVASNAWKNREGNTREIETSPGVFAVVELFTSEGCSSCPSADALFAKLKKEYNGQAVYFLSYHVDYWNRLGWRDRFSDARFTAIQSEYDSKLGSSVYTPQAVINGSSQMIGSNASALQQAIQKGLTSGNENKLNFSAKFSANSVLVKYILSGNFSGQKLKIMLVQNQANTMVKAGENEGRKLDHVNIVRDILTISNPKNAGEATLKLPAELKNQKLSIAAYLQKDNLKITAATFAEL
jgi:hypothetical protein